VGGSEAKKGPGSDFLPIFLGLLNSPHRETPQNAARDKTKPRKKWFWIFVDFFVKVKAFRNFPRSAFCSAFDFLGKSFRHGLPTEVFYILYFVVVGLWRCLWFVVCGLWCF
jgi:hypothetical protein